jgi:hypothetical protein
MADEGEDDKLVRHGGPQHLGPARTSPYPTSRLAPAHDLVDTARQIAEADRVIGTVVHAKLQVIADQIRSLQAQARHILEDARAHADLHRAQCRFQKRVGATYHLYRRPDGTAYLSMLAPAEWGGSPPHEFLGSYRLEPDMSWTPEGTRGPTPAAELRAIVGVVEPEDG